MSAIFDKLKIKNPPKEKKDILINIGKTEYLEKDASKEGEEVDDETRKSVDIKRDEGSDMVEKKPPAPITIIDRTHVGFDREQFREKMRTRGLIVPGESKPKPKPKPLIKKQIPKTETVKATQTEVKKDDERPETIKVKTKQRKGVRKLKGKKIKLVGESTITKGSITATVAEKPKRVIRKPELTIIDEAPETMFEYKE